MRILSNIKYLLISLLIVSTVDVAQSQSRVTILNHEIPAVVKEQPNRTDTKWTVYGDTEMESRIGQISAGEAVKIMGWSSLLFLITKDNLKGFISSSAVNASKEIDSLVLLTKTQFESEPIIEAPLVFSDSAKADLVMTASKKEVILGECFVIALSFNVSDNNKVRMRFVDLEMQLYSIKKDFRKSDGWISDNIISIIEGVPDKAQIAYPLIKTSYCPSREGQIVFPPVKLTINRFKGERSKPKVFKSNVLTVKVSQGPPIMPSSLFYNHRLCGDFQMKESFFDRHPSWSGTLFYSLEVKGTGLTYPISPPKITNQIANFQFIGSDFRDTIINNVYSSARKFNYKVIVKQDGQIDLRGAVKFGYLNPVTKKYYSLESQSKRQVKLSDNPGGTKLVSNSSHNLIVLDLSQSMQIEDYKPNRMGAVLEGVRKFLASRSECDTQVAVFGGNAILLDVSGNVCYSMDRIDAILSIGRKLKVGSSLGEAIMLGNMLNDSGQKQTKLVLIGDGDDTFGFSPNFPTQMAKLRNIRIYTIGVGSKGIVPFGKDYFGTPNLVENTFSDSLFRWSSAITGGQYFWAKDAAAITRALEDILK